MAVLVGVEMEMSVWTGLEGQSQGLVLFGQVGLGFAVGVVAVGWRERVGVGEARERVGREGVCGGSVGGSGVGTGHGELDGEAQVEVRGRGGVDGEFEAVDARDQARVEGREEDGAFRGT